MLARENELKGSENEFWERCRFMKCTDDTSHYMALYDMMMAQRMGYNMCGYK